MKKHIKTENLIPIKIHRENHILGIKIDIVGTDNAYIFMDNILKLINKKSENIKILNNSTYNLIGFQEMNLILSPNNLKESENIKYEGQNIIWSNKLENWDRSLEMMEPIITDFGDYEIDLNEGIFKTKILINFKDNEK